LSFDYPKGWTLADQALSRCSSRMEQMVRSNIRIRSPREMFENPEKEAQAKKLFQDNYVERFLQIKSASRKSPKRSVISTQIGGSECCKALGVQFLAAIGGMDSYSRYQFLIV
jgi:hypothetical protein